MNIFKLKLLLSRSKFLNEFIEVKDTSFEEKAKQKISDYNFEIEEVKKKRTETRNHISSLERAIRQVKITKAPKIEKRTIKEIRAYEKKQKKIVVNLIKIIRQLKKIIENESIEVLYDIHKPLTLLETFIKELKIQQKKIKKPLGNKIKKILEEIEESFNELINKIMEFLENDIRYFKSIGLEFDRFKTQELETDYPLTEHLKRRSKIKQQINGKTQYIISQIKLLEEKLEDQKITYIVKTFKEQFEGLIKFCLTRVEVSAHVIIESIELQKENHEKLEKEKKELLQFYEEFIREQQNIKEPEWKNQQTMKRIDEFKKIRKEIEKEIKDFEKEFTIKTEKLELKDINTLKLEEKEIEQVKQRLTGFKKFARVLLLTLTFLTTFSATTATLVNLNPNYKEKLTITTMITANKYNIFINQLYGIDKEFLTKFAKNDIKYKIVESVLNHIKDKYVGSNVESNLKQLAIKNNFKEINCLSFVNGVLKDANPNHVKRDRMDKILRDYQKKGYKIYFVSKDLNDKSKLLNNQSAGSFLKMAKKGQYPYIKKFDGYIVGVEAVKNFQNRLKGKVGLISFNTGFHSALLLDGKVAQAHWGAIGPTIESTFTLESHLSNNEIGVWEFAVVAIAP